MDGRARFEVRVLGPMEVVVDGQPVPLGGDRGRALFALLAANAGRVVTVPALVEALWGWEAPAQAARNTRRYVSRLRQALLSADAAAGGQLLVTHPAGYLLRLDPDRLDAAGFERQVGRGREALAAGDVATAGRQFAGALALWRGEAYGGVAEMPALRAEVARLVRLRLSAVAGRIDAALGAGAGTELVGELTALTESHPGHERLWAQLMIALYRAGRQVEALEAFLRARAALAELAGVEPSPELVEVHRRVLAQDPRLLTPATGSATGSAGGATAGPARPVEPAQPPHRARPSELPPEVAGFVGRVEELALLDAAAGGAPERRPGTVPIAAISGTAGVGKTALAVHWAHRVADRYPDGQLYLDLRGYDPQRPMHPAEALDGLLTGLGVAAEDVPLAVDARAARYRSEMAGRRILVVLDNAGTVEQLRPLLPGTPTATVVVTSRDSLAGLVALHGARRLDLDLLPVTDARALLRLLIGPRATADPDATGALADRCARLPLALRVAAELATARPTTPLTDLVAELAGRQRLDLLDAGGDPRAAVRTVFSWSLRHVPAEPARVFRLLGLHPGPDADGYAVAALAGTALDVARRALDALCRAHLAHPTAPGRAGMHDLLRAYALDLAAAEPERPEGRVGAAEPAAGNRAAVGRLLDYYLATAAAAMDARYPAEAHRRPRVPPVGTPVPDLTDAAAAQVWLAAEAPVLAAVVGYAATQGWPDHAVRLAATLFRHLHLGTGTEALTVHGHALDAARQTGDLAGEGHALLGLGAVSTKYGRHEEAGGHLLLARDRYRSAGDRIGEARAVANLGAAAMWQGRHAQAADHARDALALFRQAGDQVGEGWALTFLAGVEEQHGRYGRALELLQQALARSRQAGDLAGAAHALSVLGGVEAQLHRHVRAADRYGQALVLHRQLGDRDSEAWVLTGLGRLYVNLGNPQSATGHHEQALALFRETGDRDGEAWALNGLGEAARATGRPAEARDWHASARAVAVQTGALGQQARADAGLGDADCALGNLTGAAEHYQRALAGYRELQAPEAEQVSARLAECRGEAAADDRTEADRPA